MNYTSIFDVIGPNMIGPSSSHTAGAVSIALMARKLFQEEIVKVEFTAVTVQTAPFSVVFWDLLPMMSGFGMHLRLQKNAAWSSALQKIMKPMVFIQIQRISLCTTAKAAASLSAVYPSAAAA